MSPKFTRRHYREIATILREIEEIDLITGCFATSHAEAHAITELYGNRLIQMFRKDNPNFDPHVFTEAIHVNQIGTDDAE